MFQAHRHVNHSTLGARVKKKKILVNFADGSARNLVSEMNSTLPPQNPGTRYEISRTVLHGISLQIDPGHTLAFVGAPLLQPHTAPQTSKKTKSQTSTSNPKTPTPNPRFPNSALQTLHPNPQSLNPKSESRQDRERQIDDRAIAVPILRPRTPQRRLHQGEAG